MPKALVRTHLGVCEDQPEGPYGAGQRKSSQQAGGQVLLSSPLTEEEIEAQRREVTCPEAQSQEMAEAQVGLCGRREREPQAAGPGGVAQSACASALVTAAGAVIMQDSGAGAPACLHPASQAPWVEGAIRWLRILGARWGEAMSGLGAPGLSLS